MFCRFCTLLWLACLSPLIACSSPAAKPDPDPGSGSSRHQAVNPLADDEPDDADGMQVQGTLGTLDQDAIQAGLAMSLPVVTRCFQQQLSREPYLGGRLTLHFRVARDGSTRKVRLAESTLGSLLVERCVLVSVMTARFSRPRGGEAEFSFPLSFQGRLKVQSWEAGVVKRVIEESTEQLLVAADSTEPLQLPAGLVITFYVDRTGKARSVGMTADDDFSPELADAFANNLKQLKFDAATGGYAKVTYSW